MVSRILMEYSQILTLGGSRHKGGLDMKDFDLEIKIFDGPELIFSKDLYILSTIKVNKQRKGTLFIQKCFVDHLDDLCATKEEKDNIMKEFVAHMKEEYDKDNNNENPFYSHDEEFQKYARKRYKALFGYVNRMLDRVLAER
jgi:hypothetical protein